MSMENLDPIEKVVDKVADASIDGISSFISAICMPAAKEFGLLIKDKITVYRLGNIESIALKSQEIINKTGIKISGKANLRVLKEVFEEASWVEDPKIQDMWAGLLATASSHTSKTDDSLLYIEKLKSLTSFQARLLEFICSSPDCFKGEIIYESEFRPHKNWGGIFAFNYKDILNLYPEDLSTFVPICNITHEEILNDSKNHGIAIGRLMPQIKSMVDSGLFFVAETLKIEDESYIEIIPTYTGIDLYMRCLGYQLYPLQSFLLTMKHWDSLKFSENNKI
ncbi:hypothetical protein C0W96_06570 [Photobacterium kishitanii]|uniref:Abi-alpha family protein n=1 Tax=Photobacterium kishitanii TaxID=318456 RepID=UPI0005D327B8|nr:hypothetical protein [Photobacterium kishitanii]KJG10174.1 hypothetical protein UB40_09005 [Photobacterium kishitanii]PSV06921.1 hypothetical protein C0W96_06570 [Photobacterium kishitanii]PSV78059.1 hypothetical protein C0W29_01665 [Photobacterium kishitanii]